MNLLDTIPCAGCGTETDDPAGCDHTEMHCGDCSDEGYCRLCVQECKDEGDDCYVPRGAA